MIRFGPAAAPRWFDSDLDRLPAYLDLLARCGSSQIEFVLLPGNGTAELGRVHLLENQWEQAFQECAKRGFHIDLHAPLPADFRMANWPPQREDLKLAIAKMVAALASIESMQTDPPILVLHAFADSPEITRRVLTYLLDELEKVSSNSVLAVELRAPATPDDLRFDRSFDSLIRELCLLSSDRVGICWDIAHDWESDGTVTQMSGDLIPWIRHVHLHDSRPDGFVHAPLDAGAVPWLPAVEDLKRHKYVGSITLEIRYRYASEYGDPWAILEQSLNRVREVLTGE